MQVEDVTWIRFPARRPTLILTNPPMGRRVLRGEDLPALYAAFLRHAARVLAPGGRLVWISPLPSGTRAEARRAGLELRWAGPVDLGGITAEIQSFTRRP